ncbi:MAG: hypothetical protein K2I49_02985, partial [Ureaplasma sp.]|nr:hypothetical protein [Ureaplasma sp.]
MYKMFHIIFSQKDQRAYFKTYFYAYLLIKIKIRKEFIQLNNYPGFHNFQDYQNRKVLFIKDNSIYEKILISYSINNATKGQPVKYLEVRITPQESLDNNISFIKYLDKTVSCPHKKTQIFSNKTLEHPNFFYIFHFIKNESKDSIPFKILMTPRNNSLREKVKEQTMALNLLRRQYCNTKDRFIGVDAASSEIGYRPEIFAQAFRYLKKYSCELNNHFFESSSLNPLGFTYHVGEDFLDITDGLRAIDETIKFLNFRKGDRLGHCLALGVSPSQYYTLKKKCIILPKQDLLDNIVWLLMQIRLFNITCPASLILEFHQLYEELWDDIYPPFDDNINIPYEIYYLSWLLRGDNPNIYLDSNFRKTGIYTPITYWECCALNRYSEEIHQARKNRRARDIYFYYHFNRKVRENGRQYYEYKIKDDYIQLVENIQNAFMFDISEKQLAIETNP